MRDSDTTRLHDDRFFAPDPTIRAITLPQLTRIFDAFPGLIHFYHNDTPNMAMLEGLATIGMDVFNFSHETDRESPGHGRGRRVGMNLTTNHYRRAARCLE